MRPVFAALALLLLSASSVPAQSPRDKVKPEHWAYDSLEYLADEGVLPEVYNEWIHQRKLNRREMTGMATILSQMVLLDRPGEIEEGQWESVRIMVHALNMEFGNSLSIYSAYDDVVKDHWAYGALDYLCREGVLEGYPEGFFTSERTLTRYELAQAIARLLDLIGMTEDEAANLLAEALRAEFSDQLAEIQRSIHESGSNLPGGVEVSGDT